MQYVRWPQSSGGTSIPEYANFASLPVSAPNGQLAITLASPASLYEFDSTEGQWNLVGPGGGSGVSMVGTFDSQAPALNGAVVNDPYLYMQSATASVPGLVNNTTQTFSGNKTFTGTIGASNFSGSSSGTNTGDVTLGTANGLGLSGQVLSLQLASGSQNGALSSTDWTTFNSKQAAGSYLTALTGDGTASGPGSAAFTLATVNTNVGSFGSSTSIPSFTVNAKGLITAASGNAVVAPAGTLTGSTLASGVTASSLTSVGTIGTGVWQGTAIGTTYGGLGGNFGSSSGALSISGGTVSAGTLSVSNGGSGNSSLTAYAILAGGTTSSGAMQQVSGLGSSGQVLTSNGAGALPTWQNASGSGANTSLSNLASVAVNADINPGSDATINIGSSSKRYHTLWLDNSGSNTAPTLAFYDSVHSSYAGIYFTANGAGAMVFASQSRDTFMIQNNGNTPGAFAGRQDYVLQSIGYYEASGIQGISDGNGNGGTNCPLSLTAANTQGTSSQPTYAVQLASVATTNNSSTKITENDLQSGTAGLFEFRIIGIRTGGSAGVAGDAYSNVITGTYTNISGTATLVGSLTTNEQRSNSNCTSSISISGAAVRVFVTGDTNNNYTWHCTTIFQYAK